MISMARSTRLPLLAGTPLSSQMLSSRPTRTLPPSNMAWATIGICVRPMPKPAQVAPGGRLSAIAFMVVVSAGAPQGMPRQIWNSGSSSSPSLSICLANQRWPVSKISSSALTPSSVMRRAPARSCAGVET
ncbi:hypothetical protein PAERUG_P48_London_17_VIM_2_01_13_05253 [Pseudomonas aeruginosa]|nr:hypothetical protein PAERUG_P48_London_17_VIM_2_01_13_05253 [Pseudomonas aeruginosa]SST13133.1 Uncharacterised protein [Acinetobacter baumannii]